MRRHIGGRRSSAGGSAGQFLRGPAPTAALAAPEGGKGFPSLGTAVYGPGGPPDGVLWDRLPDEAGAAGVVGAGVAGAGAALRPRRRTTPTITRIIPRITRAAPTVERAVVILNVAFAGLPLVVEEIPMMILPPFG